MGRKVTKTTGQVEAKALSEKPAAFYAKAFSPQELKALEAEAAQGLDGEIRMLRVVMRRVMTLASQVETLEEAQKTMTALGLAATRLASLLKVHESLGGESESMRLIDQAIALASAELGIDRADNEFDNELGNVEPES